jgi:hypothetical protein
MAVIVSSSIQQNGNVLSGDIKRIAIIRTNPGYGPSPGHPGTGQVVAVICISGQSISSLNWPERPPSSWLLGSIASMDLKLERPSTCSLD